ncbi:armadillo-type protein [Calycina marina]|uniref:Armadillo-type protein n=1 Tax=Calycina marina TaxID=1763456 RepID=A0A9P8CJ21_9HELO|nr:armadillo-type protein [Calycina marina]
MASRDQVHQHKFTKSSVLRSFMHKRTPSGGETLAPAKDIIVSTPAYGTSFLPADHPHSRALGELHQNHGSNQPRKKEEYDANDSGKVSLQKKTKSAISLRSLTGKDAEKPRVKNKEYKDGKPKKAKSSTNLANLLSRPKSFKNLQKQTQEDELRSQKNKENQTPAATSSEGGSRPPIYSQFSSEYFAKQPLGGKFLEDEIDLYTPQQYSPGKQRNFYEGPGSQPTIRKREEMSQRPKSTYLPSSLSIQDIGRRVSGNGTRISLDLVRRVSGNQRPSFDRKSTEVSTISEKSEKSGPTRGKRVLAAVSGLGTESKELEQSQGRTRVLNDKDVEKEFEAMLDRRNIPEHQRGKMRSLAFTMKKDFIKQDWAEIDAARSSRPGTRGSDSSADAADGVQAEPKTKSKRPRSRNFTLSRSSSKEPSSPKKKSKSELSLKRHSRTKSTESLNQGTRSITASGTAVAQNIIAKAKGQTPEDFVSYIRKVQKPELVEVGRLHKLRLLLRNETVAWTDEFIKLGGMDEIVALLHRIMAVEWREEHEDALLHETLLCLKALATTALAMEKLNDIQITLFPALLHMIFDEEKKGPSEFTTRNIISSIMFTYLRSAPLPERSMRAKTLLSYFKDPEPNESQRPVGFVLEMRQPRPYRVWCKEISNVTKEVFWIFLHNLNVVALPGQVRRDVSPSHDTSASTISSRMSDSTFDENSPHHIFMVKHFPQELPPVPAAPYVGGVEWDATNYLASHLDILNGILSCLETRGERNALREQLRVSGVEKVMGITLRTCKEKFYGGVHAGLRCWVAAATHDGWDTKDVRCGPSAEPTSPVRRPVSKKPAEAAPKIDMKLSFGGEKKVTNFHDAWL